MSLREKEKKTGINLTRIAGASTPYDALFAGRIMLAAWSKSLNEKRRLQLGRSFIYLLVQRYWSRFYETDFTLPGILGHFNPLKINKKELDLAISLADSAAQLATIEAAYWIGTLYTATIPETMRTTNGMYFTPPELTHRLLQLAEKTGTRWDRATVLDPACGGGAFLAPAVQYIVTHLNLTENESEQVINHIETHLKGLELDFFAAWLSQVFVEIVLSRYCRLAGRRVKQVVEVCNSLEKVPTEKYDLVIGNPPYGKLKLTGKIKQDYNDSLFGHANLYGLFTHFALKMVTPGGVIAYVTPTSFLAGEYFKNLRNLLLAETSPTLIDFIILRKGIFENVLQETMLATYKATTSVNPRVVVTEIHPEPQTALHAEHLGEFFLPLDGGSPWILPRNSFQVETIKLLSKFKTTLKNWGYEVKTGPLVWNRHKKQLFNNPAENRYPLIWAESINSDGSFEWKADKKNHKLYCRVNKGQEHFITDYPCILLQRTTSKEQNKRLLATLLPASWQKRNRGVVIENHINIVQAINDSPAVSLDQMCQYLNSETADKVFRCISGSVAVSAYELENMPLPDPGAVNTYI